MTTATITAPIPIPAALPRQMKTLPLGSGISDGGCTGITRGKPGSPTARQVGGYLHVACDKNGSNDAQKNALLAKLVTNENDEAGYMSCNNTSNPNACSYVVNAGLTPTAGTFRSVVNYFKGEADYQTSTGYTSPIKEWCQKNFVVYVTDGLPSVNETRQQ